jgi:hypothetical protein
MRKFSLAKLNTQAMTRQRYELAGFPRVTQPPSYMYKRGDNTVSDRGCGDSRLNERRTHLNEENETRKAKNEVQIKLARLLLPVHRLIMIWPCSVL